MNSLAGAILLQALKDREKDGYRSDVREFLKSDWFTDLAEGVGFHETELEPIRAKAERGSFDRSMLRSPYH